MDLVEFAKLNERGMIVENPDRLYFGDMELDQKAVDWDMTVRSLWQPEISTKMSMTDSASAENPVPRLILTKLYLFTQADELLEKPYS